jgi:hypothetical protein
MLERGPGSLLIHNLAMTTVLWRSLADDLVMDLCATVGVHRGLQLRPIDLKADARRRADRWRLGNRIAGVIPKTCLECSKALQSGRRKFCSVQCTQSYHAGAPVGTGLAAVARAVKQTRRIGRLIFIV